MHDTGFSSAQPPPPTPSRPRVSKGIRTRERILHTALELFGDRGFAATSVRDIAARAGLTHAGLLHHFANKDDLLLCVLEYREQQDEIVAQRFVDRGLDQLFAWLIDIVQTNAVRPDRVALFVRLSAEATDPAHPGHAYFTRRYQRVHQALHGAFAAHFAVQPPHYPTTPQEAAASTIALMDGLQLQWLLTPDKIDMPRLVSSHLASLGVDVPAATPTMETR